MSIPLAAQIRTCTRCPLHETRTVGVPAEVGRTGLAIMGEAPGRNEDKKGRPFMGAAGKVLEDVLAEANLERADVTMMNRLRCRPPSNNIDQVPEAIVACDHWTVEELNAYDPQVVLLMGRTAIKAVFGATASVGMTRGTARSTSEGFEWGARVWVATYHPAALLYARDKREEIRQWLIEDIKLARRLYEQSN